MMIDVLDLDFLFDQIVIDDRLNATEITVASNVVFFNCFMFYG